MASKNSKSFGDSDTSNLPVADPGCMKLFAKRQKRSISQLSGKIAGWAELLDLLGWCVIHDHAEGRWLGKCAQAWLSQHGGQSWQADLEADRWPDLLHKHIPATQLKVLAPGLLIWPPSAESEATCSPDSSAALTRREREILEWLREGKTGGEIAVILGRSTRTIEKHLENIYKKLGVRDRASLIVQNAASITIRSNRD